MNENFYKFRAPDPRSRKRRRKSWRVNVYLRWGPSINMKNERRWGTRWGRFVLLPWVGASFQSAFQSPVGATVAGFPSLFFFSCSTSPPPRKVSGCSQATASSPRTEQSRSRRRLHSSERRGRSTEIFWSVIFTEIVLWRRWPWLVSMSCCGLDSEWNFQKKFEVCAERLLLKLEWMLQRVPLQWLGAVPYFASFFIRRVVVCPSWPLGSVQQIVADASTYLNSFFYLSGLSKSRGRVLASIFFLCL